MPLGEPAAQAAKPASNAFATGAAPLAQGRPMPAATHPDGGSVSPAHSMQRVGCPSPTVVLSNGGGTAGGSGQGPAAEREDAAVRARKEAAAEKAAAAKLAANAVATAAREKMMMSISGPGASLLGLEEAAAAVLEAALARSSSSQRAGSLQLARRTLSPDLAEGQLLRGNMTAGAAAAMSSTDVWD
eukprot:CAMPEP_0119080470 /NCGR_PEP_ID=MMETSP1178-20130426/112166_1 /TAXON_ID=33656 /ORGANISM="unid sp, Strain CCMP2000" /LENGTH=186 /DNA_ID=CAMNT_0007063073 /DNA_START=1 /DNA_END=562 /DNA_ORIENTATION=+